mgnify:CR=1 FL=1
MNFSACDHGKMLDIVVVLNFYNFDHQELLDLQQFVKTLFGGFDLDLNATRVGIVTKKNSQPSTSWYLNSSIGRGYTVVDTLAVCTLELRSDWLMLCLVLNYSIIIVSIESH